jgi:hypothetical protein
VYLGVHRRTGYEVAIKALNKKKIAAQKMTEKARPAHAPIQVSQDPIR